MPYKVQEDRKKYAHEWYLRKKEGRPTRITILLTPEERKRRRTESSKRWRHKTIQEERDKKGGVCELCGGNKRLLFHEIHGKRHKNKPISIILALVKKNPEDFALLCQPCHNGVHFVMEILGLSWVQIVQIRTMFHIH